LVMDAAGISPINADRGDNDDGYMDLVVNLDDYNVAGTSSITLMNIEGTDIQGAFKSVLVTQGDTTLDPNTTRTLLPNEYSIDYTAGDDNDVVLSVNIVPAVPVAITADDPGYQWLTGGTTTVPITATVIDQDGTGGHTYLWSVLSGPAASFAPDNDLSTDVTFDTAGVYTLKVEVADADDGESDSDTIEVTVYENGCASAKTEHPYSKEDALIKGDTNYDCEVNLVDFAALALNWLVNE
jgi:hypothetical protein